MKIFFIIIIFSLYLPAQSLSLGLNIGSSVYTIPDLNFKSIFFVPSLNAGIKFSENLDFLIRTGYQQESDSFKGYFYSAYYRKYISQKAYLIGGLKVLNNKGDDLGLSSTNVSGNFVLGAIGIGFKFTRAFYIDIVNFYNFTDKYIHYNKTYKSGTKLDNYIRLNFGLEWQL